MTETSPQRHRVAPHRPARAAGFRAVPALLLVAFAVVACSSAAPSASPRPAGQSPVASQPVASTTPASPASSSAAPSASGTAGRSFFPVPTHLDGPSASPGTVDTPAGKVWDALPPSFPIFPGLQPAPQPDFVGSGSLAIPGDLANQLVDWYQAALATSGFDVAAPSPRLEDGSRTLVAHRASQPGCVVRVTIGAKGTMTFVTVGYGASCSFE